MSLAAFFACVGIVVCAGAVFAFFAPRRAAQARLRLVAWIVAGARRGRAVWRTGVVARKRGERP